MKGKSSNPTSKRRKNESNTNDKATQKIQPIKLEDIPTYYNFVSTLYKGKKLPKSENFIFSPDDNINNLISYIPRGDITNLSVDAIVSATNTDLQSINTISDSIYSVAGPELAIACKRIGVCETGHAVITPGYNLPAKNVIHAVGPIGRNAELLKSVYNNILNFIDGLNIRSVALCCISTGIYGYPIRPATKIALRTVRDFLEDKENQKKVDRIIFVVNNQQNCEVYNNLLPLYFPLTEGTIKDEEVESDDFYDDYDEYDINESSESEDDENNQKIKKECNEFIEIVKCPECNFAMIPPSRTPMIIQPCGHTICKHCISKKKECPVCLKPFKSSFVNDSVCKMADILLKNGSIPECDNPPQPVENKLIQQINPLCTFAITGKRALLQKYYRCLTCKIEGICEICSEICHKDHDVELMENCKETFCNCGLNSKKCKCMSYKKLFACTAEITYGIPTDQPMYQCTDCNIEDNKYICQQCALKCHIRHKLKFVGFVKDSFCSCFQKNRCQVSKRKPICTYFFHPKEPIAQPWYYCLTCGGKEEKFGCCEVCAKNCHKGHKIVFDSYNKNCFCDCGDGHFNCCKMCKFPNNSYLTCCTNLDKEHKDEKKKQRMYHCLTCGIYDDKGICEACAINCHVNHLINYVGDKEFACSCTENCQMINEPLLRNDRIICDRKVLQKDDISPCYTCYTCDPSGKKQICETCALKIHKIHDIHFIGYIAFECG